MDSVTTLDSRRRGVFPPPFQPGDVLVKVSQGPETITFRVVKPADVPLAPVVQKKGYTLLNVAPASRESIAAAIRAERDA